MEGQDEMEEVYDELVRSSFRGTVVRKKQKVSRVTWVAREVDDCARDAEKFRSALITSVSYRQELGLHDCHRLLSECLDLHKILSTVAGDKSNPGSPYNMLTLVR